MATIYEDKRKGRKDAPDAIYLNQVAPPEKGRRLIGDNHRDAPRGFALVVRASGGRSFVLRYNASGKDRLLTIGDYPTWTLAAARKRGEELRREIDAGADPLQERRDEAAEGTLADAVERYCQARTDQQARGKDVRAALVNHLVSAIGGTKVPDVRRRDVLAILDKLAERHERQAALLLTYTKQFFEWCEDREIIEESPVASLTPKRIGGGITPKTRSRVLSADEIRAFWNAEGVTGISTATLTALRLVLVTAQRPGEVWRMRWADIDGDLWTIPADHRLKTETAHAVPLTRTAVELLSTLPRRGEYVFGQRRDAAPGVEALSKAVRRSLDALDNQKHSKEGHWRPHDLRRTARTGLAAAGVSESVAEMAIGHTKKGIVGVYDRHGYEREKRAALEAWERRLLLIAEGQSPDADNVVNLEAAR